MLSTDCVKWLYRLDTNYSWESGLKVPEDKYFSDSTGIVRLIIEKEGRITVTREYAWNGCSPKFVFLDLLWGTPDGAVYRPTGRPKAYFASLIHDALYQFLGAGSPISRREADGCFRRLLGESEFRLSWIYWVAVRLGGWTVWKAKAIKREWKGTAVRVPSP